MLARHPPSRLTLVSLCKRRALLGSLKASLATIPHVSRRARVCVGCAVDNAAGLSQTRASPRATAAGTAVSNRWTKAYGNIRHGAKRSYYRTGGNGEKGLPWPHFPAAAVAAAAAAAVWTKQDECSHAKSADVTDYYEIGDLLGEGGYGTVHVATRKEEKAGGGTTSTNGSCLDVESKGGRNTSGCVAIKKVDKARMDEDEFMNEFTALKAIHDAGGHPHIAGMQDMFEGDEYFYLVLELVSGGELFEHLIQDGAYSEQTAAAILRDLAGALRFLHRRGIVHADLKPENLMLSSWNDEDASVKLVDFGSSCGGGKGAQNIQKDKTLLGTPAYWPPELVEAEDEGISYNFNAAADMWAMGVIMYIMLVGAHPFDLEGGTSDADILRRVADSEVPMDESITGHLSESALSLIRELMEKDPIKRLTAAAMLKHPWTTGETASEKVMEGVDEKLASFQEVVKSNLESGVFSILVQQSLHKGAKLGLSGASAGKGAKASVEDAVGVIRQAFGCFDKEGKGFVSATDISRVLQESGEVTLSAEESSELDNAVASAHEGQKGVSMESFEQMMSSLETVVFNRGDVVFAEGDAVETSPYMYILGSGKVDILKSVQDSNPPAKMTSLSTGDIFGESAILHGGKRSATVRCATPVQAVRIGRDSLGRMMKGSRAASADLREMSILRDISRAKSLLKAVRNINQRTVPQGSAVVHEGDLGDSMYTVMEGKLEVRVRRDEEDEQDVSEYGQKVATLSTGDVFGEMALMLKQPRSATVVCSSGNPGNGRKGGNDSCVLNEIKGGDFVRMLKESENFQNTMEVILRTRIFRRAMLRLTSAGGDAFSKEKMRDAFDMVDMNKSNSLDGNEVFQAIRKLEANLSEEDVRALIAMADLDQDGSISFSEFCRILQWEENPVDRNAVDGSNKQSASDD